MNINYAAGKKYLDKECKDSKYNYPISSTALFYLLYGLLDALGKPQETKYEWEKYPREPDEKSKDIMDVIRVFQRLERSAIGSQMILRVKDLRHELTKFLGKEFEELT